ncbi:MAG: hypothetical protein KDK91_08105 [Gammaproteobacteria bacterium]|nr:hypothetical protein [Gammaproteobacteria bacterium]
MRLVGLSELARGTVIALALLLGSNAAYAAADYGSSVDAALHIDTITYIDAFGDLMLSSDDDVFIDEFVTGASSFTPDALVEACFGLPGGCVYSAGYAASTGGEAYSTVESLSYLALSNASSEATLEIALSLDYVLDAFTLVDDPLSSALASAALELDVDGSVTSYSVLASSTTGPDSAGLADSLAFMLTLAPGESALISLAATSSGELTVVPVPAALPLSPTRLVGLVGIARRRA